MKETRWKSIGSTTKTPYIESCWGQVLQMFVRCAWSPPGGWQAARPLGEYSFLGCTVAPGFEFQDFEMLSGGSAALAHITSLRAELAELA